MSLLLQHNSEKNKCECDESEKKIKNNARLNPKHYNNKQSAAKP